MKNIEAYSWPIEKLGEAVDALARKGGLSPRDVQAPRPPESLSSSNDQNLGRWIETAAGWLGIEAEPVEIVYGDVEKLICNCAPAILKFQHNGETRFLALLRGGDKYAIILEPDLAPRKISSSLIRSALCRSAEEPLIDKIDKMLEEARVPKRRRSRARAAILRERLAQHRIGGCWMLRLLPGADFLQQTRRAGLYRRLFTLVAAYSLQYILLIASWWLIGRAALQGRLDQGWLIAWALLLLTLVPFNLLATWTQGMLSIGLGGLLKQRLLYGALRLEPEEIRSQGAGQLLGRVIESQTVESLALSGGFLALVSIIEVVLAASVLAAGAGGLLHGLLLFVWVLLTLLLGRRFYIQTRNWTEMRLSMTQDLVERMVGHRTRIAQESREHWHDGEDRDADRYLEISKEMDRTASLLIAGIPRGWLILGLLGLAPGFVSGSSSAAGLAVGLGGLLLGLRALDRLTSGLSQLADAAIAWRQVSQLFYAAARPQPIGSPVFALAGNPAIDSNKDAKSEREPVVVEAHDIIFRYRDRGEPVLKGCNLQVRSSDRILLEGASGGGKSTFASLVTGLRLPESGLLLLHGLDRQTLGAEGWRRLVVSAPQFHENHVLTGTFAFNLLMGRAWPPNQNDAAEAEAICRELGLGELLERMPAGLLQQVGETGWQLSHGERSRLYIARALLQKADLVVLDESFAALDPENLRRALHCVLARAKALLVIAHP